MSSARSVRDRRRAAFGYRMSAPAFAMVAGVTLMPIVFSVYLSLNRVQVRAGRFTYQWAGLDNYATVVGNQSFHSSLAFTVGYTLISVAAEMVLGLAVALVVNAMAKGRAVVLAMLLVPYAMITVIAGQLWAYMFNGEYGIVNHLLTSAHLIDHPISWLSSPASAIFVMVFADTWKTVPFVTVILLAGLQAVDPELYEAAKLDGASAWRRLRSITVPLIASSLTTALIFRVIQALGIFDLPFVLTRGGPGTTTQSVAMLAYNVMFENLNFGAAAAITSLTTLFVLVVCLAFTPILKKQAQ